jgi:drug/metabolite transporter (DMT)-like permease
MRKYRSGPDYIAASMSPDRRGLSPQFGMLLVVLFWAGNFTAAKIAFTQLDPLAFTALRFVLASVVFWMVVHVAEGPARLPYGAFWPLVWLGVIGNTIYQICFMEGLERTSATKSSLIIAGMPALVTLTAGILGIERVTAAQRIAVLVATAGVVVVVVGRGGTLDHGFGLGEELLLGAVFTWTAYTLLLRRWNLKMSSLRLTAWTMYTGTPGLVLVGIPALRRTDWTHIGAAPWAGLLYSSLLSLVAAYTFWNRGVAMLGAARTVVFNTIVPLVATGIAVVMLGERPGWIHVVGALLIVGGVLLTGRTGPPEG